MARQYLRYEDLAARKIVNNRTTLSRWIKHYGFPPGVLLGPRTRAWTEDEIAEYHERRRQAGAAPSEAA